MRSVLLLLSVLLLAGCSHRAHEDRQVPDTGARAPGTITKPIGERCLDCHAEIVRAYSETGMAHAVGPVGPEEPAGLLPVTDAAGWTYRFDRASERQSSNEWHIFEAWKSGDAAISAELIFAIGAGLMDRSYAARVGDLLWFAPLEIVGRGERRRAALAPGHAIRPSTRFTNPIAEECLACHTDRLPARDYPLNLRPDPGAWRPAGISCSACHGDVEGHAEWREADLRGERRDATDPILTASRAGWIQSLSLCARCHLQGDASLLLEPRARGVIAPGGDMLAKRAVFVAATQTDEIGFVSQVERLVRSRCFTESTEPSSSGPKLTGRTGRAPLTCLSCHDPHRSSFDPKERAVVRNGCLKCHTTTEMPCSLPAGKHGNGDCVDCHMRRTHVFDVAGVEIHDHFVRRRPGPPSPPADLRVKESKDGKLAVFAWPGADVPTWVTDPGLWMMAEMSVGRGDLALPFALREPGSASAALATYHHLRGSLLESMGLESANRLDEARAAYERALAIDPGQTETAVNLGLLLGRLGRAREGIDVLDAAIAEHPKAAGAMRNRALLELGLGDRGRFAADLEAAFAISPEAALARALADHHARSGNAALAERWKRAARTLDPVGFAGGPSGAAAPR